MLDLRFYNKKKSTRSLLIEVNLEPYKPAGILSVITFYYNN